MPDRFVQPPSFYFDECLLGAAKELIRGGFDVLHPGHVSLPNLPLGSPDSVWMAHIAATGLIAVTRDRRFNRKSAERELIRSAGLKVVWLTGRSDMRPSEQAALFRAKVSAIYAPGEDLGDGPWGLGLSAKGRLRVIRLT